MDPDRAAASDITGLDPVGRQARRCTIYSQMIGATPKLALFEETMLPHLDAAYNMARWVTGNEDDAQDVVQEAYLRAFRFFDGFRGGDARPWLLAVVRNTALTWRRRARASTHVSFDEEIHRPVLEPSTVETQLVDGSKFGHLRECLESLPLEFREVVVMRELEEMSYRDIAEAASVPVGTVMSRLSRARQRLLDCVKALMKEASK